MPRSLGLFGQTGRDLGTVKVDVNSSAAPLLGRPPGMTARLVCLCQLTPVSVADVSLCGIRGGNEWLAHTHSSSRGSSVVIIEITVFSAKCATAASVPAVVNSIEA